MAVVVGEQLADLVRLANAQWKTFLQVFLRGRQRVEDQRELRALESLMQSLCLHLDVPPKARASNGWQVVQCKEDGRHSCIGSGFVLDM